MQTNFVVFIRVMFAFRGRKKLICNVLQMIRVELSASNISDSRRETRRHQWRNIYNCVQCCYDFSEITSKLVNFHAYWRVASVCNQKLEVLLFVL